MTTKEYHYLKNEPVPQWMINSEVAFFGVDVKVVAHKHKTVVSGACGTDEHLIRIRNKNGEPATQVCPTFHFIIEPNVQPFHFKNLDYKPYSDLCRIWSGAEGKMLSLNT